MTPQTLLDSVSVIMKNTIEIPRVVRIIEKADENYGSIGLLLPRTPWLDPEEHRIRTPDGRTRSYLPEEFEFVKGGDEDGSVEEVQEH